MASGGQWDAEKMLQLYVHDYMVKKNMHKTAEIFAREANVCNHPVVIDIPEGFLSEWWSIFYDMYDSRQVTNPEAKDECPAIVGAQMTSTEPHNAHPLVNPLELNQQRQGLFPINTDFDTLLEQPAASMMAAKMYEEERLRHATAFDPSLCLLDVNKMTLPKSAANIASSSQQQARRLAQQPSIRGIRQNNNFGRTIPRDPTFDGIPKAVLPRNGPCNAVMNNGVNLTPLGGWPLTGADQIPTSLVPPVLNSFLHTPNHPQQLQQSTAQHQKELLTQFLSQKQANHMASYPRSSVDFNTGNLIFPWVDSCGKDKQMQVQPLQQDQIQNQQLLESGRKRRSSSNSRAGVNTSVHKGDEEDKLAEENIEFFLSRDDDVAHIASTTFGNLQHQTTAYNSIEKTGFSFEEMSCFNSGKGKVLCCNFSSNGKLLASAGHDKKVIIWHMDTLNPITTAEVHSHLITDVRFKPGSTVFATSSFNKTVQLWDAANPIKPLLKLLGHSEHVMSLDFHPQKVDLVCSCDRNSEIRMWNVNGSTCTRVTKGATRQVRFQPQVGKLLAAAGGNGVSVIDVETDALQFYLKGHTNEIRSICWDASGQYIASVSEDSAKVWSAASGGKCIYELHSNGNKFESCIFHPVYSLLLVIGGYQSLELWNASASSKTLVLPAHKGIIAALDSSPQTGIIASASHDSHVKLWK